MCELWTGILDEYITCLFTCNALLLESAVVMQTAFRINAAEKNKSAASIRYPSVNKHSAVIKSDL